MESSRISLRPFRETDVDDMLLWAGDDRLTRTIRWETLNSKEEALSFIKEVCMPRPWHVSICIDDLSIGFFWAIYPGYGDDKNRADIGYAIAFDYWGQGITTKVLKMAIPRVFNDFPKIAKLQAYAVLENKASRRVLEKAGFLYQGDDRSRADVGYAIAFEYWGQGIAAKAVKMATPQVYNDFPEMIRLQAFAYVENKASQWVLKKAGFLKEGILKKYCSHKGKIVDLVIYSVLSTDTILSGP